MSDQDSILIIDDSRVSRLMIKSIVSKEKPDMLIFEAANADEALAIQLAGNLTHIIVDFNMPGMDGITLSEELQKRHPDTSITLLTANIQASTRNKASDKGIKFAKKPVTEERILSILKK